MGVSEGEVSGAEGQFPDVEVGDVSGQLSPGLVEAVKSVMNGVCSWVTHARGGHIQGAGHLPLCSAQWSRRFLSEQIEKYDHGSWSSKLSLPRWHKQPEPAP